MGGSQVLWDFIKKKHSGYQNPSFTVCFTFLNFVSSITFTYNLKAQSIIYLFGFHNLTMRWVPIYCYYYCCCYYFNMAYLLPIGSIQVSVVNY